MKTLLNLRTSLITRNRVAAKPAYNTLDLIHKLNLKNSKLEVQSGHDVGLQMPVIHEVHVKGESRSVMKQSPFSWNSQSPKSVSKRRVILTQKSLHNRHQKFEVAKSISTY